MQADRGGRVGDGRSVHEGWDGKIKAVVGSLPSRGLVFLALHSVSPGTTGSWQASWTDAAADAARAMERN